MCDMEFWWRHLFLCEGPDEAIVSNSVLVLSGVGDTSCFE